MKTISIALLLMASMAIQSALARVVDIEITESTPVMQGKQFGDVGAYERIKGIAHFEIEPDHKRNKTIADLNRAPKNSNGKVQFRSEFEILRPVDSSKSSGVLIFEALSQGEKLSLGLLHDIDARHSLNQIDATANLGNGFFFRKGHSIAWAAWQGNVQKIDGRLTADFPVATNEGDSIEELTVTEFNGRSFGEQNPTTLPLSGRSYITPYSAISTDQTESGASLYMMESASVNYYSTEVGKGEEIPKENWAFAHCPDGWPGTPSTDYICVKNGFLKNRNYHLLYKAIDPPVMGLGLATTRDFLSFLKNHQTDAPSNHKLTPTIDHVLCQGISQGGKYLRDFLYQGFNVDTDNKKVCDGINIHAAGVEKTYLNYRFSQPYRQSMQHSERFIPDVNFPRQYSIRVNPFLKFPDGILKKPAFDPLIFHTDTSTEYWQSRASLVGASEGATMDFTESSKVRRYLISSTETYNRFNDIAHSGYGERQCLYQSNNVHIGAIMRALITSLEDWVVHQVEPVESIYPRVEDKTLVEPSALNLPKVFSEDYRSAANGSGDMNFGPRVKFNRGVVDILIPEPIAGHKILVPQLDELGHEIAGIRHPRIAVPTGTHLGWNIRTTEFGGGDLCDEHGAFVPLSLDDQQAAELNDSRPSLLSLYPSYDAYVDKFQEVTNSLVEQRFLLEEDATLLLNQAKQIMSVH
jgi:hypothetical protein